MAARGRIICGGTHNQTHVAQDHQFNHFVLCAKPFVNHRFPVAQPVLVKQSVFAAAVAVRQDVGGGVVGGVTCRKSAQLGSGFLGRHASARSARVYPLLRQRRQHTHNDIIIVVIVVVVFVCRLALVFVIRAFLLKVRPTVSE